MAHTAEHRATANVTGQPRFMLKYLFRDGPTPDAPQAADR